MLRISDILESLQEGTKFRRREVTALYEKGTKVITSALEEVRRGQPPRKKEIETFLRKLIDEIFVYREEFLAQFYRDTEYSLSSHILNSLIVAISLCSSLGWKKKDIVDVALALFFCDISLVKFHNLIAKPKILDGREKRIISYHPSVSSEVFRKLYPQKSDLASTIENHHQQELDDFKERQRMFVEIIQISDIFEALTHLRPHRKGLVPAQAVRAMINREAQRLNKYIFKTFIDSVGIYPPMSLVQLSDSRQGVVVSINKGFPLRPKLKIIKDVEGRDLIESEIVDLLKESKLYIEKLMQ